VIFDATGGIGRCRAPSGCAQSGELCGHGGAECCPGGMLGQGLCQPAGVAGIERCVGEAARVACLPTGARCASPAECCMQVCAPSETAGLACAASCISTGRSCTRDADCCDGSCIAGACVPRTPACLPYGAACSTSGECCSGLCPSDTMTCSSPI
jgi:hypothetical protein